MVTSMMGDGSPVIVATRGAFRWGWEAMVFHGREESHSLPPADYRLTVTGKNPNLPR